MSISYKEVFSRYIIVNKLEDVSLIIIKIIIF